MYGTYIDLMEVTGWTWDELMEQPADLIDEWLIRMREKAKEQKRQNKIRNKNAGSGRGRGRGRRR